MAKTKQAETEETQLELTVEDKKDKNKAEDTTPKKENDVVVANPEPKKVGDEAEKALKDLQERLAQSDREKEELKLQRDALQKQTQESSNRAETAEARQIRTQKEALENSIESAKSELISKKAAYKTALEAGDSAATTELAEEMADAKYKLNRATEQKGHFDHQVAAYEAAQKAPKAQQLPPSLQDWMNKNPKYKTDPEFKAEADGAHAVAIERGYTFGSPAYIEFIDARVKKMTAKEDPVSKAGETEEVEDTRTPAVPPSRSSGENRVSNNEGGNKKFTIPASVMPKLKEYAAINGMTPAEYAKELDDDGRLKDFIAGKII